MVLVYLIVNGRGHCRLAKRRPSLDWDEIAFPINVEVPPGWGRVYDQYTIALSLPPPPVIEAPDVGEPLTDGQAEEPEPEEIGA